jgi:carboxyl-terminal processing protease
MLTPERDKTLTFKKVFGLTLVILAVSLLFHFPYSDSSRTAKKDLHPLTVYGKGLFYIQNNYVDPELLDPQKLFKSSLQGLEKGLSPVLITWDKRSFKISVEGHSTRLALPKQLSYSKMKDLISQVLGFINTHYNGDVGMIEREHFATAGLLETLDPHSTFLFPEVFSEFKVGTKGSFGGLGIVIGIRDHRLTVITPLEDTPAFRVGLKSQDKISQIDGESTINMSLTEAVGKLRGRVGTKVEIVVQRAGSASSLNFTLTRALIVINSVDAKLLKKNKIGLLKIKTFQQDTLKEVKRHLKKINRQAGKLNGLILDLRNNPGGLLDQAVKLADLFLSSGVIVSTVSNNQGFRESESASQGDDQENIPLIVLINEGSASASEIVAGALQIHGRALVIGNSTFGKGSVQTIYDLRDGSAVKLTIAKYLLANDIPVQSIGITPDIALQSVTVNDKVVDIAENESRSEKNLKQSFKEDPLFVNQSFFRLPYLNTEETDDEKDATGKINIELNFPVILAEKILANYSDKLVSNRLDLLNSAKSIVPKAAAEEAQKITAALTKRDVDWALSTKAPKGHPKAKIEFWITNEKDEKMTALAPGTTSHLHLKITNKGTSPFEQLIGTTQSEDHFFKNHEFIFGRIDMGKSKSWQVPLKTPGALQKRREPLTIQFTEAWDHAPDSFQTLISTAETPKPSFSFNYHLTDDGTKGSTGNGDGLIQQGETIVLSMNVMNIGQAESKETVINLINKQGKDIFIKKGRGAIKSHGVGKKGNLDLVFKVDPDLIKKDLKFNVALFDPDTGNDLSFKLTLPMNETSRQLSPNIWHAPPEITIVEGDQILITKKSKVTIKGIIKDDIAVKSFMVFNGEDKVYYQNFSGDEKQEKLRTFDFSIPLEKDGNLISIIAEDFQGLNSRKQWMLWRQP